MDPRVRGYFVATTATVMLACGGNSQTPTKPSETPAPTPLAVTVSSVTVGVAGSLVPTVAPGDKLQLFAQATNSDGSVIDATNVALWQSSNPALATVSAGGLVTAFAEGALDVTATYQNRSGSLHAEIAKPGCRVTLNPTSLSFGALQSDAFVTVSTTLSDCRWAAKSNASWLPVSFDPGRSGSGGFSYSIPGNNTPDPRDAEIVISVVGGPASVHRVHQERPVGCVYSVSPTKLSFSRAGGTGSFDVTTQPADCQWRIDDSFQLVPNVSPRSGTGATKVTYTVVPNAFSSLVELTLRVRGLSGLNPPAVHTIQLAGQ
jgi:Bacterial Ig-like domain (group 2)